MYSLAKLSLNNPLVLPQVGHVIDVFVDLTAKYTMILNHLTVTVTFMYNIKGHDAFAALCSVHQMCFKVFPALMKN